MNINVERTDLLSCKADLAVIPIWSDDFTPATYALELSESARKSFLRTAKMQDFTGAFGATITLPSSEDAHHTLSLVGLGAKNDYVLETAREWTGIVVAHAKKLGAKTLALALPGEGVDELDVRAASEATCIALELADYAFDT
ncbi:MAG: hypothetical protein NUV56_03405, partial [Candidatus Uhrbacteria bacterium]|nr:hypothetical protein [Candidatus Uhrbacteria bacterium]